LAGRTHNPASSSKYRYVAEKREGEVWTLREVLCQKEPILHHKWPFHVVAPQARRAGVAELVDARVSKTRFFGSAGSTPAARTICNIRRRLIALQVQLTTPLCSTVV
jgi:hypothetical protein